MSEPSTDTGATDPLGRIRLLGDLKTLDELCVSSPVLLTIAQSFLPRSKKLLPIFKEVASELFASGSNVVCAQIDPNEKINLEGRFDRRSWGFPTIVLCRGPHDIKPYRGPHRKNDILAFVERQTTPDVTNLHSSTALDELRKKQDTVVVAYLNPEDQRAHDSFAAAAKDLKDDAVFCISSIPDATDGPSSPSVVVYKNLPEHEEKLELSNIPNVDAIREFVKISAQPLITELLPELHEGTFQLSLPIGYIFVSSPEQQAEAALNFLPVARKYRHRVHFYTVNTTQFIDLTESMHFDSDRRPAFALRYPGRNYPYPLNLNSQQEDSQSGVTPDEVDSHVERFLAGKLQPAIKSQPIPETQTGPIVEVVGLSYDDIVLDPKKDVLVEFYTPWCGPCKALLPAYEQLAAAYAADDRARDLVTIAKVECDGNDVPDTDILGFPWFKLYPAGKKDKPVRYDGLEWNVDGWARFIAEDGSHGVELLKGSGV
ncbi:hypothetical protein B0T16DRAFT_457446 [Cercophora newfieldiana]|uniref:Protein disulfide-isomerase n=1 Tax=Cercophora newfieldiana TaxID=92897 RepID=A0AA40CNR9_9PEZI|nr:hypothetical protein B0T16DRAFT_457446 [Cercophora newfieldiana]